MSFALIFLVLAALWALITYNNFITLRGEWTMPGPR